MNDAAQLNALLEKYRFVEPIPEAARKIMLKSRKRVLKACLKKVNNYSIFFGVVLFFYFLARSLKLNIGFSAVKIIAVAANIVTIGIASGSVYAAVKYTTLVNKIFNAYEKTFQQNVKPEMKSDDKDQTADKSTENPGGVKVEILLYNGKIFHGVIISRGYNYILKTPNGNVAILSTQIKNIRKIQ